MDGLYAFHGIRSAPNVVWGLKLPRMDAKSALVTHPLLRKDITLICLIISHCPQTRKRTVIRKTTEVVLKAV